MRSLLLIPISLLVTAGCGLAIMTALGRGAHGAEMGVAAGMVFIASGLATIPLILARHATQLGLSQAALVSTAIHLLVSISLAAVAILGKLNFSNALLYWLMAFYWVSLIALVTAAARMIKSAAPEPTTKA